MVLQKQMQYGAVGGSAKPGIVRGYPLQVLGSIAIEPVGFSLLSPALRQRVLRSAPKHHHPVLFFAIILYHYTY